MQSKGVIKLLAILLAIACIYQLSFSLKARSVEKKAAEYAAKVSESDSLRQAAEMGGQMGYHRPQGAQPPPQLLPHKRHTAPQQQLQLAIGAVALRKALTCAEIRHLFPPFMIRGHGIPPINVKLEKRVTKSYKCHSTVFLPFRQPPISSGVWTV